MKSLVTFLSLKICLGNRLKTGGEKRLTEKLDIGQAWKGHICNVWNDLCIPGFQKAVTSKIVAAEWSAIDVLDVFAHS